MAAQKHSIPLQPVALEGIIWDLESLQLREGEAGLEEDPLGLYFLVREGVLKGRSAKEQADRLDAFKEKIRAMVAESHLLAHPPPVKLQALEDAYRVMLQLYLHPHTALLKKAAHRVLLQLTSLAVSQGVSTFEASQAHAFLSRWILEEKLSTGRKSGGGARGQEERLIRLKLIEETASYPSTRRAMCTGSYSLIQELCRYTIVALSTATGAWAEGKEVGADTSPQLEGAVAGAREPLSALTALLGAWRIETRATAEEQQLLAWMCREEAGSRGLGAAPGPLIAGLLLSALGVLRAAAQPTEVKAQASLALVLLVLQACPCPAAERGAVLSEHALTLRETFLPTSGPPSQAADSLSFPPLRALPSLLKVVAEDHPEARLSLIRALLIAAPVSILTASLPSPDSPGGTLLGGPALDLLLEECQSPLPPIRLLAFMGLETWLLRAAESIQAAEAAGTPALKRLSAALGLARALPTALDLLLWNWETSNRRVASVVPSAFERLLQLLQTLERFKEEHRPSGLVSTAQVALALTHQAPSRRSRYAGLKLLLPIVGSRMLLSESSHLVPSLIDAVAGSSSTAASASRLLLQLLRGLRASTDDCAPSGSTREDEMRALWVRPVATALLRAGNKAGRLRVADYLLEEVLSHDPGENILALLWELRRLAPASGREGGQEDRRQRDTALWSLVVVAEVARRLGGGRLTTTRVGARRTPASALTLDVEVGAPSPMLSLEEARAACLSGDADLRMAALRMLVASAKTTTLPSALEQHLIETALPVALKAPLSGQRHGLERALRPLFLRYQEALRVLSARLRHQALRAPAEEEDVSAHSQRVVGCIARVAQLLCEGFYPGTNVSRSAPTLDVLALFLAILQPPQPSDERTAALYSRAFSPIHASPTTVLTLLNLLLAPWERTRRTAFDLLASFPAPLSGLGSSPACLAPAIAWSLELTRSARRGESEAGALMLRLVFKVYVVGLGWRGLAVLEDSRALGPGGIPRKDDGTDSGGAETLFLRQVTRLIEERVEAFQEGLAAWGLREDERREAATAGERAGERVVMVQGAVQAAKYILEEAGHRERASGEEGWREEWNEAVVALVAVLERVLEVALGVVGTAQEGLPESLLFDQGDAREVEKAHDYTEEAALHTAGPGLVVDCRGHLIRRGGAAGKGREVEGPLGRTAEGEADKEEEEDDARQRLIVGGWMMVKEAGACLAEVVQQATFSYSSVWSRGGRMTRGPPARGPSGGGVLERREVESRAPTLLAALGGSAKMDAIGRSLLQALGRLKHMGAIQVTQSALLTVSRALLLSSDPELARLPDQWMQSLLDRLRHPRVHFVLRRSAGLASGFLGVVGAEPTNRPPILLPALMGELLRLAAPLQKSACLGTISGYGLPSDDWRTRIHALNVLRLLLLDAGPSRDVAQAFMAPAMEVVLVAFRDARWAVRNSALMVFGALINSVVGSGKNSLGAAGCGEGAGGRREGPATRPSGPSSAHDFLRRHPDFLFIVAGELNKSIGRGADREGNPMLAAALSNLTAIHVAALLPPQMRRDATQTSPCLFPLILLLSRLRPPSEHVAENETSGALDESLKQCLPSVVRCACFPEGLMRLTAARAFASLVGPVRAAAVVVALLSALPPSCGAAHPALDPAFRGASHEYYNTLHGILLMINSLLRSVLQAVCRLRHDDGGEVLGSLRHYLPLCSDSGLSLVEERRWLTGPGMTCPPVREEALQMFLYINHLLESLEAAQAPIAASERSASQAFWHTHRHPLHAAGDGVISTTLQHRRSGPREGARSVKSLRGVIQASVKDLLDLIEAGVSLDKPLPGFASLIAWATRWSLPLSLTSESLESRTPCLLEKVLATWLRHRIVEVRREALRVLLFLLNRRADLGDGQTQEDGAADDKFLEQTLRVACREPCDALWQEVKVALVAQVQERERNPSLLKGQMEALCSLFGEERRTRSFSLPLAESCTHVPEGDVRVLAQNAATRDLETSGELLCCIFRHEPQAFSSVSLASGGGGGILARKLELMGHVVGQEVRRAQQYELGRNTAKISYDRALKNVEEWMCLIESAALPTQTSAMRQAALSSLRVSGLGVLPDGLDAPHFGPFLVRALFAVSMLAQDDEDAIREGARSVLEAAVAGKRLARPATQIGPTTSATPCLDPLIGYKLSQLARCSQGVAEEWGRAVVRMVILRIRGLEAVLRISVTPPHLGLSQQIFRPEPDNVFEEPALVSYWAVRTLIVSLAEIEEPSSFYEVGQGPEGQGVGKRGCSSGLPTGWFENAELAELDALWEHAGLVTEAFESSAWPGGLTYHPDVFAMLFVAALGQLLNTVLAPVSGEKEDRRTLWKRLQEVGESHPLMAWALSSLQAVSGKDEPKTVQARAKMVLDAVNWTVVDKYTPFARPGVETDTFLSV
ncbi:hypothetical protein NSK_006421 [Nannochloropsis salina CCMP1776]|jgi:hypothetical protein|uniref:Uncharacterized protein n=1 Tax=Nannochloropsis salina CCMP1776 TaxID=1027361 RepID=A0A4D9CSW5_9STRA|nr:hypothetical protein NSK_006421 [Nannochloropsis salina CCMP1776]|eukprot:TFJ82302.1 hypothetical protein NSK_006421 [Nannochloropsis salina CCMP1776]